ncbi:MAG: hypothetical protein ACI977_000853 [Candidatus Nanohaloarchaea archaeon]|jgi:hypothetical protein
MTSKTGFLSSIRNYGLTALILCLTSSAAAVTSPVSSTGMGYNTLGAASGQVWIHRLILLTGLLFVSPIVYFLWKSMKAFSLESIMGGSIRYIYGGSLILSFLVVKRAITVEFGYNLFEIVLGKVNAVILSDFLLVSAVFLYAYGFKIITTMYEEHEE